MYVGSQNASDGYDNSIRDIVNQYGILTKSVENGEEILREKIEQQMYVMNQCWNHIIKYSLLKIYMDYDDIFTRYTDVSSNSKGCENMKIAEARQIYSVQIKAYQEQKVILAKQKKELENKINKTPDGQTIYAGEAATLELTINAVNEKQREYQEYMEQLMEQWVATANMEVARQQGEAMEEYAVDLAKIMEVARRIMKGGIVPADDEKKLMEYSFELYQAAKNIGALAKEREEYDSLWEEEKDGEQEQIDPHETADNAEAFADGPEVVSVADAMESVNVAE